MQLTGYRRACGKRNGGMRSIAIVQASAVAGVDYDADADCYTGVRLETGAAFAVYHFREDGADFTEKVASNGVDVLVTHTLSFALERMDRVSARAVREFCTSTPDGFVAIVTTNNDVSVLAGYSERFGLEYPLRLQRAAAGSGMKLTDVSAETVALASTDTEKAKAYAGELPR